MIFQWAGQINMKASVVFEQITLQLLSANPCCYPSTELSITDSALTLSWNNNSKPFGVRVTFNETNNTAFLHSDAPNISISVCDRGDIKHIIEQLQVIVDYCSEPRQATINDEVGDRIGSDVSL